MKTFLLIGDKMAEDTDGNWVTRAHAQEVISEKETRIKELENVAENARKNVLFIQEVSNTKQKEIDRKQGIIDKLAPFFVDAVGDAVALCEKAKEEGWADDFNIVEYEKLLSRLSEFFVSKNIKSC